MKNFETIQNSNIFISAFQSKLSFYKNAVGKTHIKKNLNSDRPEYKSLNDLTEQGLMVI